MLLHVVVHLLLLVASILIVFRLLILVFVEIALALFINLVVHLFVFEQEVLLIAIVLIKLSLLLGSQLLSKVVAASLSQRYYTRFFLASTLPDLGIVRRCRGHASPSFSLLLLPILLLDPLALLIKMVMQK